MFPSDETARQWSMKEVDEMDLHFFDELMDYKSEDKEKPQQQAVYLSDVW